MSSPSTSSSPSSASSPPPAAAVSSLLAQLPAADYERLLPALERVHLALKQVLFQPGEHITHVYFPIDSLVSMLTILTDGGGIETGMVGPEGMVGLSVFLHTPAADRRAICQAAGAAWRLPVDAFLAAVDEDGALSALLRAYTHHSLRDATQTAACNAAHPVEERAARWLLMVADRLGTDHFPMTQQFLSEMLGVRRATVGLVTSTLARAGLIQNGYGSITITNRTGLETAACECFQVLRVETPTLPVPV